MSTSLADLLHAVLSDPLDDTPRLMYADELDEMVGVVPCHHCGGGRDGEWCTRVDDSGNCLTCSGSGRVSNGNAERAEFIRVQCRRAYLESKAGGKHVDHPEAEKNCVACALVSTLKMRDRELWNRWGQKWCKENVPVHVGGMGHGIDDAEFELPHTGMRFIFARGFVSEIHAPLAVLMGGVCPGCEGRGVQILDGHSGPCPDCATPQQFCRWERGSGRTPGILKDLFSQHPITRVVVTDREPLNNRGIGSYFNQQDPPSAYLWLKGSRATSSLPWEIPDELWCESLSGEFDSEEAALDALSYAVVTHGRALAGLPPITQEVSR